MPRAELWWRRARRGRHSGTARRGRRAVVRAAAQWRVGHIGERHALAGGTARDGQHGREVVRYSRGLWCRARSLTHVSKNYMCMCQWRVRDDGARYISSERNYAQCERDDCRLCSLTHTLRVRQWSLVKGCVCVTAVSTSLESVSRHRVCRHAGHIIAEHDHEHSRVDTTHELARCTKGRGKVTRDVT